MTIRACSFAALLLSSSCRHATPVAPPRPNAAQSNWLDLTPQMELRIQNAYYRDGFPKHGVDGYLGTETAHFQVRSRGLRLLAIENVLKPHPREQTPVQELIPASRRGFARYRYFYAVVFNQRGNVRGSVLLGAGSVEELDRIGESLIKDPDSVCSSGAAHCMVFPEMCTVSIDLEIFVNGVEKTVSSGTMLASIAGGAPEVELLRQGVSKKITAAEMRMPLMAGDQIRWN